MKILAWNCQGLGAPWTVRKLCELVRLHDPGLVLLSETKSNGRRGEMVKERLNYYGVGVRSKGNSRGLLLLWRKDVDVWIQSYSDHHINATAPVVADSGVTVLCSLGVIVESPQELYVNPGPGMQQHCLGGSFSSDTTWLRSEECKGVIENAWKGQDKDHPIENLSGKISSCSRVLRSWDRSSFGNITRCIKELEKRLKVAENIDINTVSKKCIADSRAELEELLEREETLWKQRGKALWLKEGSRNTSFFHARATEKCQHKEIKRLKMANGEVTVEPSEIQRTIMDYYSNLFIHLGPKKM
ncbi:UNVERIFIED_CONTAM: hypothetical protein Sradi_2998800 [Sesamum radiatum]|uniref:Endonuclease/exonuclease/phosphatase domain-containing protein n=1 Tax=Sesamum radiatum TaxID=300843 RepID=A0AAW2S0B6_SESRA